MVVLARCTMDNVDVEVGRAEVVKVKAWLVLLLDRTSPAEVCAKLVVLDCAL